MRLKKLVDNPDLEPPPEGTKRLTAAEFTSELWAFAEEEEIVKFTINGQEIATAAVNTPYGVFVVFAEVEPFTGAQWAYELRD